MKNPPSNKIIAISIIIISLTLAVLGYIILPDTLVMQITSSGESGTTLPKAVGLILPLLLSVVFAVLFYVKQDNKKHLLTALIGLLIYAFIFFFNLK
ncbi:MAG: DUF2627 family protein [Eubacteriales bacterium]